MYSYSCLPRLAALNLGGGGSAGDKSSSNSNNPGGGNNLKNKKKPYWGSNSSLRKSSVSGAKERKNSKISINNNNSINILSNGCGPDSGNIEFLQDLDLYYIKQIAHNLKEFDLEQKIDLEIKMREGSTKLLAASKHQSQSLEAAKNLLVSNERMTAYLSELQKRKRDVSSRTLGGYSKGRLSLSDLRIPLMWRDIDHFKNKGDYRRFAVFCLVKIASEMYDTSLICPIDRSLTDITFPDVLIFNKVNPDFSLQLEIYGHMLQDDLSIASAPRRIKNTIHTSISRTVGKKLAATLRDELSSGKMGPSFELMATARLSLDDVHDNVRTHDLEIQSADVDNHRRIPLFGSFCCRLAAQPGCMTQETYAGYVTYLCPENTVANSSVPRSNCDQSTVPKESSHWVRCWAQLKAFQLNLWPNRENCLENRSPLATVTINKDSVIIAKRNSYFEIEISNECSGQNDSTIIRTESLEDRSNWFRYLTQHVTDHLRWKQAAENFMEIQPIESARHSYIKSTRYGSLYDQTPILEYENGSSINRHHRASSTVSEFAAEPMLINHNSVYGCSSSSAGSCSPFSERSLSLSTNINVRSTKRTSYWSFSKK